MGHACETLMLRTMCQNIPPSMIASVIADTLHHMIRTDFIIAMQLLCTQLNVPSVNLVTVFDWLRDGTIETG